MTTNLGRLGSNSTELITEWRIQCIFILCTGDENVLLAVIWKHQQNLQ